MSKTPNTKIRLFGILHSLRRERGLPSMAEIWLPAAGRTASEVAAELDLPPARIAGVFCNHLAYSLDKILLPGDEIAFIPTGLPGAQQLRPGDQPTDKDQHQQ